MANFPKHGSLNDFQKFIADVYGLADDRLFSLSDIVSNQERFTMRALKGIRKADSDKLKENLMISFSWLMALANRLHIDIQRSVWQRFPGICSYCGKSECVCREIKPKNRIGNVLQDTTSLESMLEFQEMFEKMYNPKSRSLSDAGVHLAEEMGELSEAVHCYLGEHKAVQFQYIQDEISDFVSCIFGVANSAKINMAEELAIKYWNNCHTCHKIPCKCSFAFVAKFES